MLRIAKMRMLALVSLISFGACAPSQVAPGPPLDSRARPPLELRLPRLGGGVVDLVALRGRPVLLFLFATWSLRAQAEAAEIRRIAARYDRLAVVGVALDARARNLVQTYIDFVGFDFPIALATPDNLALITAVGRTLKVPRSVLLDGRGQLVQDHATGQTDFSRLYGGLDKLAIER